MNQVKIIGLAGPAFVGKTTIADSLSYYTKISYAEPLKDALIALTGMPRSVFYDKDEKLVQRELFDGKTSRKIMQMFGTEFCRNMIAKDFWIRLMRKKLTDHKFTNFVIDDVRFQDEADLIIELGGIVVNLTRDGVEFSRDHESEMGVRATFDLVLPDGVGNGISHFLRALEGYTYA
jgi:hypothetical protein